jgi:hypothetical protein
MLSNHPYPYVQPTSEEIDALMRRAHAERARAVRDLFVALFRRKPPAEKAEQEPALTAAACR